MPRILIASLPQDRATAESIAQQLAPYENSVGFISEDAGAAATAVRTADVLLVIVGADWAKHIQENTVLHNAIELGLRRGEMLVINLLLGESRLPSAAETPPDLQGLAYINSFRFQDDTTIGRDILALSRQIRSYYAHLSQETQITPQVGGKRRSRIPWNLIILGTVLGFGILMLFLARLRDNTLPALPATTTPQTVIQTQVRLGVAAGMSENAIARGQEMLYGVQLALEDRPAITVEGQSFTVDVLEQDTGCDSLGGLRVAERFAADTSVMGVIGDLCDVSCAAAAPLYDRAGLTMISPGCSAPNLGDTYTSFNRTIPSREIEAVKAAEYIYTTLGLTRVAVMRDELVIGRQLAPAFQEAFIALGGTISHSVEFNTTTDTLTDAAQGILESSPELVYFAGRASNAALLKAYFIQQGSDIPLFLADDTSQADYLVQAGDNAQNTYTLALLAPDTQAVSALAVRYEDVYGIPPEETTFAYAYDATQMLLDAIQAAASIDANGGLHVDKAAVQAAVRAYQGEGITGTIACDGTGDCTTAEIQIYTVQAGEWVTVP